MWTELERLAAVDGLDRGRGLTDRVDPDDKAVVEAEPDTVVSFAVAGGVEDGASTEDRDERCGRVRLGGGQRDGHGFDGTASGPVPLSLPAPCPKLQSVSSE